MTLQIEECPYCEERELFIWPKAGMCSCQNDSCSFGRRRIDELEAIQEGDYEDKHEQIIELMTRYDKGKLP